MNVTIVSAPPFEPLTLQELYEHLRLTPYGSPLAHPDDLLLQANLATARQSVEREGNISLVEQTVRLSTRTFDGDEPVPQYVLTCVGHPGIRLLRPPVLSVLSVSYYDAANVLQTVDVADYYVTDEQIPRVLMVESFSYPTLYRRPDAVRVVYKAGHAPASSPPLVQADYAAAVPDNAKSAIKLGVQMLYDDLSPDDRDALSKAWHALVDSFGVRIIA